MTTLAKSNTGSTSVPSTKLEKLAGEINERCAAARESVTSAAFAALQAGALLNEAKTLVPHGHWLPWLHENVSVSDRQAQKWMRVAREWPAIEANTNRNSYLTIEQGLELISEPRETQDDDEPAESPTRDETSSAYQSEDSPNRNGSSPPEPRDPSIEHSGHTLSQNTASDQNRPDDRETLSPTEAIASAQKLMKKVIRHVAKAEKASGGASALSRTVVTALTNTNKALMAWKQTL